MDRRIPTDNRAAARHTAGGAAREGRRTVGWSHHHQEIDFRRKNWILFGSGLLSIVLGFTLLSTGDITLAPILLLLGYLVLVPWALVARPKTPLEAPSDDAKGR